MQMILTLIRGDNKFSTAVERKTHFPLHSQKRFTKTNVLWTKKNSIRNWIIFSTKDSTAIKPDILDIEKITYQCGVKLNFWRLISIILRLDWSHHDQICGRRNIEFGMYGIIFWGIHSNTQTEVTNKVYLLRKLQKRI